MTTADRTPTDLPLVIPVPVEALQVSSEALQVLAEPPDRGGARWWAFASACLAAAAVLAVSALVYKLIDDSSRLASLNAALECRSGLAAQVDVASFDELDGIAALVEALITRDDHSDDESALRLLRDARTRAQVVAGDRARTSEICPD